MVAVALIVALAMAVSACSFNAPCRWPLSLEPQRPGWPAWSVPQTCHADRLPDGAGGGTMRHFQTVIGAAEAVSRSPRSAHARTAALKVHREPGLKSATVLDRRIHAMSTPIVA
jgi:hypothetical protein